MAKKKITKNNKRKQTVPSKANSKSFLQKYWQEKSPVLKFILGFTCCIIVFYFFYYSSAFEASIKQPLLAAQAVGGGALLNLFGHSVEVAGDVISDTRASVKISGGCDGLEATALFLAAILVFPIPFKYKWPGLLIGFLVLSLLNLFRIVGLFITQKYWPEAFDFMHVQGGLYLYSIITILLMLIWADWALRHYRKEMELKTAIR